MQSLIINTRRLLADEQQHSVPDALRSYVRLVRAINDRAPAAELQASLLAFPDDLMWWCASLVVHMVALAHDGDPAVMTMVEHRVKASVCTPQLDRIRRQADALARAWRALTDGAWVNAVRRMSVAPSVDQVVEWLLVGDERGLDADVSAGFEIEMARALGELIRRHLGVDVPVHTLPDGFAHIKPIDILWALCKDD